MILLFFGQQTRGHLVCDGERWGFAHACPFCCTCHKHKHILQITRQQKNAPLSLFHMLHDRFESIHPLNPLPLFYFRCEVMHRAAISLLL